MTALELMLHVDNRDAQLFYHKDTKTFDWTSLSTIQIQNFNINTLLSTIDENNIRFLTYEEIDHKELMSFFVHECVDDKETRKKIFIIKCFANGRRKMDWSFKGENPQAA
jgi:hypothetical protein